MTGGRVHKEDQTRGERRPFQRHAETAQSFPDSTGGEDGSARRKARNTQCIPLARISAKWLGPRNRAAAGLRWLTVIDGGRMINMKTATNQILGAVVMGIGMAMLEETVYDQRNGKPVNNNLRRLSGGGEYRHPGHGLYFSGFSGHEVERVWRGGIGEIGLTGCASAVTNAVYHATGVRVRELPVRLEKLLKT